jgi:transcriptional regulator with XRE-family HTH domain
LPLRFDDIGNRLKAFRLGSGLSAEEVAKRIGISRTALYRFEKGEVVKIDTLEKLAELLQVSLPTLLGVGVEYIASAVTYFERMRQIEETAEHIIVLAGPLSYLLASDAFNAVLGQLLKESIPEDVDDRARAEAEVEEIMAVLTQRKETYRRRQPAIVNLIAASEISRFLINGMVGRLDLPDKLGRERRALAAVHRVRNVFAQNLLKGAVEGIGREQVGDRPGQHDDVLGAFLDLAHAFEIGHR